MATLAEQKRNRKKWIQALRSGKFKQGMVYLEKNGKHCCLGVACRVIQPKGSIDRFKWGGGSSEGSEVLNDGTLDLFGITDDDQDRFSDLNDDRIGKWSGTTDGFVQSAPFEVIAILLEHLPYTAEKKS